MGPIASICEELNPGSENPVKTIDDYCHLDTQIDRIPTKGLMITLEPRERQINHRWLLPI